MTSEELKDLKARLWHTADQLRSGSGLKASQYSAPILGLIFLRFADRKYSKYEAEILEEYNKSKGTRAEKQIQDIATRKCGFYLPDNARYEKLLNLPEEENLAFKIKEAMLAIEKYSPDLEGVLPKDEYYTINSSEDKSLLKKLLKNFKDIPDDINIDIFGEIYEYFLGEFALAEGQGGGEFFTPPTVVRYMVEVLAPTEGKILDPACGSGGMFVQTAHYITRKKEKSGDDSEINLRAYGVEKTGETVKLAKMNLALNNIRGEIIEANSYYSDPHDSYENFDYVMANPPFNVDEVELDLVKNQPRFSKYGIPQKKTKSSKKDKDKTERVPNANYLWINQFATALKPNGRAALVMANSASDAGNSEKDIRINLIESGIISQMVTLPSNMFNTVTLPATLWFFNRSKPKEDEILFIDARNIFTVVDRAHRRFSDEQIKNLAIISRLYEGKSEEFWILIEEYIQNVISNRFKLESAINSINKLDDERREKIELACEKLNAKGFLASIKWVKLPNCERAINQFLNICKEYNSNDYSAVKIKFFTDISKSYEALISLIKYIQSLDKQFKDGFLQLLTKGDIGEKKAKQLNRLNISSVSNGTDIVLNTINECLNYWLVNIGWLLDKFPDGKYRDITGLCKAAAIEGEDGIKDQDYSLNPGRYVGVVIEEDGLTEAEFKQEFIALNTELTELNTNTRELEKRIADNLYLLVNGHE